MAWVCWLRKVLLPIVIPPLSHDSYWFKNIVDRGYHIVPPKIKRWKCPMLIFPRLSCDCRRARRGLNIDTGNALLITPNSLHGFL